MQSALCVHAHNTWTRIMCISSWYPPKTFSPNWILRKGIYINQPSFLARQVWEKSTSSQASGSTRCTPSWALTLRISQQIQISWVPWFKVFLGFKAFVWIHVLNTVSEFRRTKKGRGRQDSGSSPAREAGKTKQTHLRKVPLSPRSKIERQWVDQGFREASEEEGQREWRA